MVVTAESKHGSLPAEFEFHASSSLGVIRMGIRIMNDNGRNSSAGCHVPEMGEAVCLL